MGKELENVVRYMVSEPLLFGLTTAIGLLARGSERVRQDWHKTVVQHAYSNGGLEPWYRWSLMFLNPKDREAVYKDVKFVLSGD